MSQQINLFNPVFLKQDKQFSARAMGQAMLLMVCGLLLLFIMANYRIADTRNRAKSVSAQLETVRQQVVQAAQNAKPIERNPNLDAEIRRMEARIAGNREVLSFLQKGDFGSHAPYSTVLAALARRTMPGVWLTGLTINDSENGFDMSGRVVQPALLPAYIRSLSSEPAFKGKSFSSVLLRAPSVDPAVVNARAGSDPAASAVEFLLSTGETTRAFNLTNGTNPK